MPEVHNPSPGPGAVPLLSTVTSLTSAQIKALSTTPAQLIPAPGAGKIVAVLGAALVYAFGTAAYNPLSAAGLDLFYAGDTLPLVDDTALAVIIFSANDTFTYAGGKMTTTVNVLPGDDNKAVVLSGGLYNAGPIVTATLGAGGTGYAANDTGTITTDSGDATYKVLTVGAGGAVLTFQITGAGTAYTTGNGKATATGGAQPGVGVNFTVNITAVKTGDGTLKVTTYYQIVPVP